MIIIFIISTSFIEVKQRMWIGYYSMNGGGINWYGAKIIKANSLNEAKALLNTYIKTDKDLSKSTFVPAPSIGYYVREFFEEEILK